MQSVMLDSSFLICLSNDQRPEHQVARRYFEEFITRQVPMHLSVIAVCEYEVRQRITDLGIHNFLVEPFNFDHAVHGARVFDRMFASRSDGDDRVAVKDDAKLLSQCVLGGIEYFITSDVKCANRLARLRREGMMQGLPLPVSIQEPFSERWFNGNQDSIFG